MKKFDEKPDHIIYKSEHDTIEVRPSKWELVITEKENEEEEIYAEFDTRDEAREAMMDEIKHLEGEDDTYETKAFFMADDILKESKVLAEDKEWVMDALKFWKGQFKKHPKSKHVKEQLRQFENWEKQFK